MPGVSNLNGLLAKYIEPELLMYKDEAFAMPSMRMRMDVNPIKDEASPPLPSAMPARDEYEYLQSTRIHQGCRSNVLGLRTEVVIGSSYADATAAKNVKMLDNKIEVTLVGRTRPTFPVPCPMR